MTESDFTIGDLFFIGPPAPLDTKVVWKLVSVHQADEGHTYATLYSGMTERRTVVPVERLHRFVPRVMEPAND